MSSVIPIEVTTLTPFAYHSLAVQGGSATLPELISDTAIAFGLAATLGMMSSRVALPRCDYRRDLSAMPYRASIFTTRDPRLLPPLTRRLNLDAECGLQQRVQNVAKKGNLKDFFHIQEVPHGQHFYGLLCGLDPFAASGQNELVIRIGLHRSGMCRLQRATNPPQPVRLNAATAHLFGRELAVERYCLHNLQLTPLMEPQQVVAEVANWQ